jgi:HD-like signal output (HDOD) protein
MAPDSTRPASVTLPGPLRVLLQERISSTSLELPLLPDTHAQVLATCNDERCDSSAIADLIVRDQSLAAHVLQVSNSVAYAPKEPIVSLQQAVSRLGISTICEISIAVSLKGRIFRVPGYQTRIRELWMRSAASGVYGKEVARLLRRNVESGFLCGLLHDVGMPVAMQVVLDVAKERNVKQVPSSVMEAAMLEFHEVLGARLVELWKLPAWMTEAIGHHHDYSKADEHRDEAMLTHLCDHLTRWALDETLQEKDFPAELAVVQDLNLYGDDLVSLLQKRGRVLEIAEAFL